MAVREKGKPGRPKKSELTKLGKKRVNEPGQGRKPGTKQPESYALDKVRVDPITNVKKTYWETEEKFDERCEHTFGRMQVKELYERLAELEFDVIDEIVAIYRGPDLSARTKMETLLKLIDYLYPKRKAVELTQKTDTRVEYISTIVFEEPNKEKYDSTESN